ncbi:TPA: FtsX-like permease family protein [Candidatus Woesearchaeota archaeon]|nr:FtsX-like permease family protein [Candidatus Woesearchaeota archaeon]
MDPLFVTQVHTLHEKVVAGSFLDEFDDDEIVIGSDIVGGRYEQDSILGGTRIGADLNDKVVLTFANGVSKEFRVKGIIRTKFLGLDIQAWVPLKTLEKIMGTDREASQVMVRLYERDLTLPFVTELINSGITETVSSWEDNAGFSRSITKSMGIAAQVTKVIGVLTAFATVFIVITIKINHRRSQIATMRAVGISDGAIMGSYIIEALFLGVIGIIVGFLILTCITFYFSRNPLSLPIGSVVPSLSVIAQIKSALLLLGATLFAGFSPTSSALKENIIEAIRGGH